MLTCVALCSVLQCCIVCCSALQCVCSYLHACSVQSKCAMMQCGERLVRCVAVFCNVLQCACSYSLSDYTCRGVSACSRTLSFSLALFSSLSQRISISLSEDLCLSLLLARSATLSIALSRTSPPSPFPSSSYIVCAKLVQRRLLYGVAAIGRLLKITYLFCRT